MQTKLLDETDGLRTIAAVFDIDDEVMDGLQQTAEEMDITGAGFTAIGAFREATVAYFDWDEKEYQHIPVEEQVEVVSLIGDVAEHEGDPAIHAHTVLATSQGQARAGHLVRGIVRPTLEVVITETPAHLRKSLDETSGLALIDLSRS